VLTIAVGYYIPFEKKKLNWQQAERVCVIIEVLKKNIITLKSHHHVT
jgi:hypothetical protein